MTAQLENIVVKVINAVVLAVVVGSLLFVDFTGRGRLWDTIRGVQKAEVALQAPEKANVQQAEGADRFMVTQAQEAPAEQAPVEQAARPAQPTASQLAAQVPDISAPKQGQRRLTTSLSGLNDPSRQARMQTSASIDGSVYHQQAPAAAADAPTGAAYTAEMPSDEQAAKAVAARYARAGRSEMMGRAAGPVYNLKSNKAPAPAAGIGTLATPGQ